MIHSAIRGVGNYLWRCIVSTLLCSLLCHGVNAQSSTASSPAQTGATQVSTNSSSASQTNGAQVPATQSAASPSGESSSGGTPALSATKPTSEISSRDEVTTFKVKVNLVLVRVVVRDAQGRAVGSLHKEDFELFDNRKPQVITHFTVEQPGSRTRKKRSSGEDEEASVPAGLPERYIAYVFDDVHLEFGDLARVRDAADRHMAALNPEDRAAIFTTSGQGNLDFTDDHALLHDTLLKLRPRPVARSEIKGCPDVTLYMADLIENKHDPTAVQTAIADALHCAYNDDTKMLSAAQQLADSTARMQLQTGEAESHLAVTVFQDVIRRVGAMPGQRSILLLSPGFLGPQMESDYNDLVDRALRAEITISALNARGLYVINPLGDISQGGTTSTNVAGYKAQFGIDGAHAEEDVLAELSNGTGGTYYHNSNDLDAGLKRIATAPEYFYVLGFSPQNLKLDGRFHNLKVSLKDSQKLTIQARKGYYAPSHAENPAEQAKREIEEALFSQEELHDLPIALHTQFFKSSDLEAKLAVLVHVDVKQMRFRKEEGRNRNDLTIVSGLFDRNGRFITGSEKILEMRLKDDTLANRLGSGITLKSSFDVKPGSYLVRLVVRDAEGQLAATNGAVEIP